MVDLAVDLGGLKMRTPVTTASGTFGYGTEYVGATDYAKLGAVTVKGVRRDPWPGNPLPRHVEVFGGLVNAIGLQGPGVEAFASHYVKHYVRTVGPEAPPLIVNIWGGSVEEYAEVAEAAADFGFENGWIQGYEASDAKLALLGENMSEDHGSVK